MKFSIIIPVYNTAGELRACVGSVLSQGFYDFELILVDDGSTDGDTPALCDALGTECPQHIRVIHKSNGGAGDARNAGITLSQGDYLLFLDSDDALLPNALSTLYARSNEFGSDILYFGMQLTQGDHVLGTLPAAQPHCKSQTLAKCPELLLCPPSACCAAWKRELFLMHPIRFRAGGWGEDLVMTRKMLAVANSVVALSETLYDYHISRPGSVTNRKELQTNREILGAISETLDWYRTEGLFERYHDELCYLTVMNAYYDPVVRILKQAPAYELLSELREYAFLQFPDLKKNPYLRRASLKNRIVFRLLLRRHYRLLRLLLNL